MTDENNTVQEKKLTPAKQIVKDFLERQDKTVETYFKKLPKSKDLSKHVCSCCGKELNSKENFWRNYSYSNTPATGSALNGTRKDTLFVLSVKNVHKNYLIFIMSKMVKI